LTASTKYHVQNHNNLYQQITPFTNVTTLFIARQHAERDSVMANPSVEPSSADGPILCLHEWTYHHTFLTVWWGHHSRFWAPAPS